jgi:excinuclease ABC subunit A
MIDLPSLGGSLEEPPKLRIRGARTHNLKNINLDIPKNQLVVMTGLSGSGKSSLAFDTLYAEGQRRYVESLSAYARQFLQMMDKPDVDSIEGLSPAIAIEQKATSHNPRSTVGTVTEIHDYLRLLFARVGTPYCPTHGVALTSQTVSQMVDAVLSRPSNSRLMLLAPLARNKKGEFVELFRDLQSQGFLRCRVDDVIYELDQVPALKKNDKHQIDVVIDRFKVQTQMAQRLAESFETALRLGQGRALVVDMDDPTNPEKEQLFSATMACPHCAFALVEMEPRIFSFNSPLGACPNCDGLGQITVFDPTLITDAANTREVQSRIRTLEKRWTKTESHVVREHLAQFQTSHPCPVCEGTRLKEASRHVHIGEAQQAMTLPALSYLSLQDCAHYFDQLTLSGSKATIADKIVREIRSRLRFLNEVGLAYLSLSRNTQTLSGGEAQRIRLASQIGSGLTGVMYVLDEPSIGLHQRDNDRLIGTLIHLRDLGNTVLVVEHDEDMIRMADHVIDMGPGAGIHGGHVVAQGHANDIAQVKESLTGQYLSGHTRIATPTKRQTPQAWLHLTGASGNNLRDVDASIPLGVMTCVTGVSGSGKSTLVNETLAPALAHALHRSHALSAPYRGLSGIEQLDKIIVVDQSPIGRTPRSNPATYTGLFTPIRELMAQVPLARERGYGPGRFSFNVAGGRCEACQGDGVTKVEMHFLSDVYVTCDICQGQRYNRQTLDVRYKDHTIWQILEMTVAQALDFFASVPTLSRKLQTLMDVGLSYIQLGQAATTLSGGEAQRVKLALELSRRDTGKTLYVLDEPTTGLHFADIALLLKVLHQLKQAGNTVLIIEHNLDVIKTADWLIDMGPEGGAGGGQVIAAGTPEELSQNPVSHTGRYLRPVLALSPKMN